MNPANFPNVGGGMPGGAKPHGQMQIPQKNENASVIMNQVAQALQTQGPFTGWRAEVPIKDRAVKVYQMWVESIVFSSFRVWFVGVFGDQLVSCCITCCVTPLRHVLCLSIRSTGLTFLSK